MGRIDFTDQLLPNFSFPGVTISAEFNGTKIHAIIKDYAAGGTTTTNYYNVILDDTIFYRLKVNKIDTVYSLVDQLPAGKHSISLIKRTESSVGKSSFGGFIIENGDIINPKQLPNFKMEFIGDSWTCGYGNEVKTTSPNTGFHSINEDNTKAWGYILAKRFNSQYHATAISGRGMYRNNTGSKNGTLPIEFNNIHLGNTNWVHSNYIPDIVLIHLGTNDFYPETAVPIKMFDSAAYVSTYINFIADIRSKYSNSTDIVCVFGNSKSDWWPSGLRHLSRWRYYINAVVQHYNSNGDHKVYKFEQVPQTSPYGEDWHPTIISHNKMAEEISPFIKSISGREYSNYLADTSKPIVLFTETYNPRTQNLKVYPNPCVDIIHLDGLKKESNWSLLNLSHQLIKSGKGNVINIKELPEGTYIIKTAFGLSKVIKKAKD